MRLLARRRFDLLRLGIRAGLAFWLPHIKQPSSGGCWGQKPASNVVIDRIPLKLQPQSSLSYLNEDLHTMGNQPSVPLSYASFLKEWLHFCDEHHEKGCHADPVPGRPKDRIPDYVIDTEDHCLVAGSTVQKYAALSYTWEPRPGAAGPSSDKAKPPLERLVLTSDNLAAFCQKGHLRTLASQLPAVINEAIELANLSGTRYLWIDRLCIKQYDGTTNDKARLMNEIYSGAYFTIIAAAEGTGLYGSKDNHQKYVIQGVPFGSALDSTLLGTRWATRGWTFQEQLLSKRALVFLDDVCFWDCQSPKVPTATSRARGKKPQTVYIPPGHRIEVDADAGSLRIRTHKTPTIGPRYLADLPPIPDYDLFVELVCRYTNRDLTYQQNALAAVSKVLDTFARRSFLGGFICGLPALFLDSALLWQPLFKATRRIADGGGTQFAPLAPLPSWSWIGWKCLLDPHSLPSAGNRWPSRYCGDELNTRKLVDWHVVTDNGPELIKEQGILDQDFESLKRCPDRPLPSGWSRKTPPHSKVDWFVHDSQPEAMYRQPLPSCRTKSETLRDHAQLSCTTTKATMRIRRVLDPIEFEYSGRVGAPLDTSVFDTRVYKIKPEASQFCRVVTIEDSEGRWAGALRIMDEKTNITPQSTLEMIAISTGSAPLGDVARDYAENVDKTGSRCYGYRDLLFKSTPERLGGNEDGVGGEGGGPDVDLGPFRAGRERSSLYHFYNVLWVETADKFMRRKAVGRVPKEVWERNCSEPVKIELG